ncbi:MAG: iron-containing alcohol dehydrogenase [Desulfobacula sp.]|nr:iron-containing alcohol dehydrogenase [Desulfobacula sp.]
MEFIFFANHHVQFGPGKIGQLPKLVRLYGKTLLLITGTESFQKSDHWPQLFSELKKKSITIYQATVKTEPSPLIIDEIVRKYRGRNIDVIAAIGGGSVIDAGKAVSAMMKKKESIIEYLEGIGSKSHDGEKLPFIALPTTSGTGSEATKNAVISQLGKNGFKKSLRHNNFIPDIAVVDPELTINCPARITAACGMDALTQVLESYISTNACAMTDSLAHGALTVIGDSLVPVSTTQPDNIEARTRISYASYISGLTLANAGLGVVHGFASVIGGLFDIPHGVVCGTLLAQTCRMNIESLLQTDPDGIALKKYNKAANLLDPSNCIQDTGDGSRHLVSLLEAWTSQLDIPTLGSYGVADKDINRIVKSTGLKNNPVILSSEQLSHILRSRL